MGESFHSTYSHYSLMLVTTNRAVLIYVCKIKIKIKVEWGVNSHLLSNCSWKTQVTRIPLV